MTGSTNILIATKDILYDLSSNIFKNNAKKAYKNKEFEMINMTSIITLGLGYLSNDFDILFKHFQLKPFIMTFIENNETEISHLQSLIAHESGKFEHATIKEIPISKLELEGFRYRVYDAWSTINNHKADLYQQLDFKKKLLKTPELKEEFESNSKEREVLVKSINDLRKKIDHGKVLIS
jgi:ATP-dependent RNA helicase DDX56/DBP9